MNNKILIAASVGLSLFAAAQSQTDKQKPKPSTTQTQSRRDLATGQASGRSTEQKAKEGGVVHRDLAARDVATGRATGKTAAQDDWHQQNAVSNGTPAGVKPVSSSSNTKAQSRVATGDVNGDGASDVAASRNSGHATEAITATSPSKIQNPRDVATGQASGKRQHPPVTKPSDKSPN
jgi:hypothetical protein